MRSGSSPISHGATLCDHRRGHPGRAVAFAPAGQAVIGLDLDQHGGARVVPGTRIGERLRQRCLRAHACGRLVIFIGGCSPRGSFVAAA